MANGLYQHGVKHFARGNILWLASGGTSIKAHLVDTADYAVDLANHEFRDASGLTAASGREEDSGAMTLVDAAVDGVCDANDVTFVGTSGDACEGILVAHDSGADATSRLIAWWDSASGLPVTLGGDVTVTWNASGLFKI